MVQRLIFSNMIKIEPLGTKIIVTPIYEELQQTEGGIS